MGLGVLPALAGSHACVSGVPPSTSILLRKMHLCVELFFWRGLFWGNSGNIQFGLPHRIASGHSAAKYLKTRRGPWHWALRFLASCISPFLLFYFLSGGWFATLSHLFYVPHTIFAIFAVVFSQIQFELLFESLELYFLCHSGTVVPIVFPMLCNFPKFSHAKCIGHNCPKVCSLNF